MSGSWVRARVASAHLLDYINCVAIRLLMTYRTQGDSIQLPSEAE